MLFTPEERRALLALAALLLLGQGFSLWEEQRNSRPDSELSAWLTQVERTRGDSLGATPPGRQVEAGRDSTRTMRPLRIEPAAAIPPGVLQTGRIRINQAGAADLDGLPGIGPALAKRILNERERSGAFRRAEDLLRVSGIGPKKLAALRDRIDWSASEDPPASPSIPKR